MRPPGSEWLFLKLYGPRSGEDELLAGSIRRLGAELREARIADRWFFLRYADPDPHLRLRFSGAPERLTTLMLPRLCAWGSGLIADGLCQKFVFDTYEREVERYGGPEATQASETLFTADSQFVADLLACAPLPERTLLAVVTIDDLLGLLGLDGGGRLAWLKLAVTSRNEVTEEYRARRRSLLSALCDPRRLGVAIHDLLLQRTTAIAPLVDRLAKIDAAGSLSQPLSKLYESYVHMHCNRLGLNRTMEGRALGLLLRARETIAHLPAAVSAAGAASTAAPRSQGSDSADEIGN